MGDIIQFVTGLVADLGYAGIFFMMVLESSFFPFPSEIAMVPAGYLASTGEMNFAIAFFAGTIGALVGASINYFIGWKLGAPVLKAIVEKYGKYIFLSIQHYNKTEYFFLDHGSVATFLGRLVTGIRQIISLPAGVFKMNFGKFLFYTGAGAGLWNLVLMVIGYLAGQNHELIKQYSLIALITSLLIVGFSTYLYFQRRKYPNKSKFSYLILINDEGKILIENKSKNSEYGEKWGLFGGEHQYQENAKSTIVREIQAKLNCDISNSTIRIGSFLEKIPERHTKERRIFFYNKTKFTLNEEYILQNKTAVFIDIEELKKLEGFYITGKHFEKFLNFVEKSQEKAKIELKAEIQLKHDEENF